MIKLRLCTREQETFENAFRAQIADYQKVRPDVEIEVVTRTISAHVHEMVTMGGCAKDDFDLFLCCTDWLPEVIARGQLVDLNPYIESNPPHGWPDAWHPAMRGLQTVDGRVYGLAWHDGPEVFHYRSDLFEDATEKENFLHHYGRELEVPKTWEEFVEVAKFFTRPEEGLWGTVVAAYTDGHNDVYDFVIQLWSRGGQLLDSEGKPAFDSEIGVEALQFCSDLINKHKVASPECLTLGSVEAGDYYAQGNAAMMVNCCGFAAVCEMPEYSNIVGKNRCTSLPAGAAGSVSLNIYWVLTIPIGSKQADEAYKFMQHISAPHTDKMVSMAGANGVRLSTWNDPEVQAKYPYYEIIEQVHANTLTMPAIPAYPQINDSISLAVHRVVHEGEDVSSWLSMAADASNVALETFK
ncbi:MAG TPA: sugar ABC transporter substrate-binding protein [Fimbriimonas sp.]|nr:sugar ABC transporter substrate-binding protein [Fimbriimonas sp.]